MCPAPRGGTAAGDRPRPRPPFLLPALIALVALASLAPAARAAWMVPPWPFRAKDFTIVKRDGWYHCFYIRSETGVPYEDAEKDLGHAISADLFQWTQLAPVLPARPGYWDSDKIWAPHVVEWEGVYYLFYTGVTDEPGVWAFHQRIGLATSTDLLNWTRLDQPIFSCAQVPWSYCDSLQYTGGEFRDPFVMPGVGGNGWLMYYNTRPGSIPNTFVAGLAASTGDFTQWADLQPLWVSHLDWSGSPLVESPHAFAHAGLWYLMFTGNGDQPIRIVTGPDLLGAPETWTQRGTLGSLLGLDTRYWFASEYFRDGTHEYLSFVHLDRVDIREIVWGNDWTFTLVQPSLFHVQSLAWDTAEVPAGELVQLTIEAVNTLGRYASLEVVEVDADGGEELIPPSAIGLPDSVALAEPTTYVSWPARLWPDTEPVRTGAQIVVRTRDHTATTTVLQVNDDQSDNFVWIGGPGEGYKFVPHRLITFARPANVTGFRALSRSPLGGTALLVDLKSPTPVRLDLYDLSGRCIRNLAHRTLPAGASVIPWDGRETSGARARAGVYFARLSTPAGDRTVRLLLTP